MAEMFDREVETRTLDEQHKRDDALYRKQITYLFERSDFYQRKLKEAGFDDAESIGGVDAIGVLPFTVKDEIRKTQAEDPPLGAHVCADGGLLQRIFSTSGTTGTPVLHRPYQKRLQCLGDEYRALVFRGWIQAWTTSVGDVQRWAVRGGRRVLWL